jgi:hypothetical protein
MSVLFCEYGEGEDQAKRLRQPVATGLVEIRSYLLTYDALAIGLTRCFTAASRVFAAGPDECGFCPVIN